MAALEDLFDPRRVPTSAPIAPPAAGEWQSQPVELTRIAPRGFAATAAQPMAAGTRVRVAIPGIGFRSAQVTRSSGRTIEGEFCDPADLRLLFLGGPVERCPTWIERRAA